MGVQPPFLYDPIKTEGHRSPYRDFDPKAVTRASLAPKPPPRSKPDGPLVNFNQHPDSYLILPYQNTSVAPMNPSVKKWVKWMRILQLLLRCLEILAAIGLLVLMILIRGVDVSTGWIMRLVPGVAILHTLYGIYHLGRKASGRTPASSASYMLFASIFDVSIVPFYAFSALVAKTQTGWVTILPNEDLLPIFSKSVFLLATVGGGLHLVSLIISLYLAVTFRKITRLPPDMNPLEDNLTSRHKRNKSSISVATTDNEKRTSLPLENKRASGAAYEDLSRPPTIPFFHTRTQSTDSFTTYKSTPPPSRDARLDLPSRQYQVVTNSNRSSMADLKRASGYTPSPSPKRASYTEVPMSDNASQRSITRANGNRTEAWYTSDSLNNPRIRSKSSPKKKTYQPLHQDIDSDEPSFNHPNPLEAHPPTPRLSRFQEAALSEISLNRRVSGTGDITDMSRPEPGVEPQGEAFKAKLYGELKPGTPPIMIGRNNRQVSSGNDYGKKSKGSFRILGKRDVSGKIAEEGRGGDTNVWGTRWRNISGLG